eukprot:1621039-Lingulodinium_polyedra.AAC.1
MARRASTATGVVSGQSQSTTTAPRAATRCGGSTAMMQARGSPGRSAGGSRTTAWCRPRPLRTLQEGRLPSRA